jgi:hypothetical protein
MRKVVALLLALGVLFGTTGAAVPAPAPSVSAGWYDDHWWFGPYVDFDRTDQGAIAAGTAGGLTSVICVTTSGWACPVASAVLASAGFYIAFYGMCPNTMRVYTSSLFGYPMRCV